ncbi:MAG: protein kinase [Planctomycetia bacterium]|nr:protein kinase [Planctomycetia bacterium]
MPGEARACTGCGKPLEGAGTGTLCGACAAAVIAGRESAVRPPTSPTVAPSAAPSLKNLLPETIGGHEIVGILGSGGMGKVYLAKEPALGREVALKVLKKDVGELSSMQSLLNEAVVTGQLAHPGIVPIYQVGRDPAHGLWYTMKVVEGTSLADILAGLRDETPAIVDRYTLPALLDVFRRTCDAVAFAHHHGIVNRDLKPSNVMIGEFGEVLVMDWGLARPAAEAEPRKFPPGGAALIGEGAGAAPHTEVRMIKGTPGYMSPEQALAKPTGPASDVYALGAILYQILTLRLPVDGRTVQELIQKTVAGQIVPPDRRAGGRGVPRTLSQLAMKALSLSPESRYASARELAREVEAYLDGRMPWQPREEGWHSTSGAWDSQGGRLRCGANVKSKTFHRARLGGDVRFHATLLATKDGAPTDAALWAAVPATNSPGGYALRVVTGDPGRVEFHRNGAVVARRVGVPLNPGLDHDLLLVREGNRLRFSVDGTLLIDHRELFPMRGDRFAVSSDATGVSLAAVKVESHGPPLTLDFLALPDKVHDMGQLKEARAMYREMAEAHADRGEGVIARYKAAACSIELGEIPEAQADLKLLAGTAYEALETLGQAKIRQKEGKGKEMWGVLLHGLEKHRGDAARIELRAMVNGILEQAEREPAAAKELYMQLLGVPGLMPQETAQVTADYLRMWAAAGPAKVAQEALALLDAHRQRVELRMACHAALAAMELPKESAGPARSQLEKTLGLETLNDEDRGRLALWLLASHAEAGSLPEAEAALSALAANLDPATAVALRLRWWRALLSCAQGHWSDASRVLDARPPAPAGPQRFLALLLACDAVAQGSVSPKAQAMLHDASQAMADWKPLAEALLGRQPVAEFTAWLGRQPAELQAPLALAAAIFTAARGDAAAAETLRQRARADRAARSLCERMARGKG